MPLYALVNGERAPASKEVRRAGCADCGTPMIAKTGEVKIWHWAHATEQPGCPAAGESEWHLQWKATAIEGTQEVAVGNRRADVLAPGKFAVEFQKSPLTAAGVRAREQDWKGNLVWVFDGAEACAAGRLRLRVHPDKVGDAYRNVEWAHAPERVKAATCRSLLDLGDGRLLYIGKWYDSSPLRGYGWIVPREWVQEYVVRGESIPVPPGYMVPVDEKGLARAARRAKARHLRLVPTSYYEPQRGGYGCPLCELEHLSCSFTAGSLYCVHDGYCTNPHHHPAGMSAAEVIACRKDPFIPALAPTGTGG